MKRFFCLIIAAIFACTMLQGCASKSETDGSAQIPESTATPEPLSTPTPEAVITEEMAYEGVSLYCKSAYGWRNSEEGSSGSYLAMGEETASEYQVIFRSYTGTLVYFYVEKTSGVTRIVECVPALDIEDDAGTFDLFDYFGKETTTPVPTDTPTELTEVPVESQSHYVFQPKVCSVYMEEVFGKTMCETWFNLVDAVMAGEDTFACPDQHTYDWVMGQFPRLCFPVLVELIDRAWDREHSVIDGVASFTYLVPREEAAARIEEFAEQIEGILNDTLEDDYSDLEKALALYVYFYRTYEYDYETEQKMYESYVDYTTTCRLFKTGIGICSEVAPAYSYLLMQAGVEATIMMGGGHEWSYVRINGNNYHIDPTFVLSDEDALTYFMMTDEQREVHGYGKDNYIITSNYSEDNPHPDYTANDDTFAPIWEYRFEELLADTNKLRCWQYTEGWEKDFFEFDYSGY